MGIVEIVRNDNHLGSNLIDQSQICIFLGISTRQVQALNCGRFNNTRFFDRFQSRKQNV